MPTRARRAAETSSRPPRSLARPPQWDSQPKVRSTTQRRASTTKPLAAGSRETTRWRMPCRFDHSRQRSAANAPSYTPSRKVGQRALPASSASGVSRSCTEAGTTAPGSQWPSASTRATRLRPTTPLAASYPRGPRTAMHLTACVSTMASVGPGRLPASRRRRRATSRSRASNRPSSSQRRNQPYTVRHGGQPAGRLRHGPPTRRCQAIAPTTRRTGVARPLRGGSARSSHPATSSTAHAVTTAFRPGSCRARCAAVHILPSAPNPDDHAPPSETPRSGGNRRPIRTQTGCQRPVDEPHRQAAGRLDPQRDGLDRAVRRSLRPKTRAGRPGRRGRAGRDVALPKKKSNKLWVWKARDRATGRIIDWELGGRDKATCERLLERLERWGVRLYCADGWAAYAELIPQGRLFVGKEEPHGIERAHPRQRHWLARFRRRTCVVSRAERMVEASIALFARFADQRGIDELLSMLA